MKVFNIVVIGIFVFAAVLGVLFFAGVFSFGGGSGDVGAVEIWGTMPSNIVVSVLEKIQFEQDGFDKVIYREIDRDRYERELIDALASGRGPDIFFVREDMALSLSDKAQNIPFAEISKGAFTNRFVQAGELFLHDDGIQAVPFSIDPVVLYWNRSILQSSGFARPPVVWEELLALVLAVTERDQAGNITRSAVSFGAFDNVTNAKEILSLLVLQGGDRIVTRDKEGELIAELGTRDFSDNTSTEEAVRFFTEFGNPARDTYTWNTALPSSRDAFIAGDLALYFGSVSELPLITAGNPNLNIGVSSVPQLSSTNRSTFAHIQALSISRVTPNPQGALTTINALTSDRGLTILQEETGLPPVSRTLLSEVRDSALGEVFRNSALVSTGWLDPDPEESDTIFRQLVRDIQSGRESVRSALTTARVQLERLLNE